MDSTYTLQTKINRYYDLIDGLSYISNKINGSVDNLKEALNKFESAFNIDSLSADNKKLERNCDALIERKDAIKNVIIPSIYAEIRKIKNQIEALEIAAEELNF